MGGNLPLEITNLGEKPGQVVLQLEQVALPVAIREWNDGKLVATVPPIGLAGPTKADLFVVRADGQIATVVPVELVLPPRPTSPADPSDASSEDADAT